MAAKERLGRLEEFQVHDSEWWMDFRRHAMPVIKSVIRKYREGVDLWLADDIFSELALKILEKRGFYGYRSENGSFSTWLYNAINFVCLEIFAAECNPRISSMTRVGPDLIENPGQVPKPDIADVFDHVRREVLCLQPVIREVIIRDFLMGQKTAEIAEAQGVSPCIVLFRKRRGLFEILRKIRSHQDFLVFSGSSTI